MAIGLKGNKPSNVRLGQKRTFLAVNYAVRFTSKSDNRKCETHVPDMRHSVDQLVSARAVTAACRAIELIGPRYRLWLPDISFLRSRHRIARIEVVNPLLPHPHKCTGG